MANCTKIGERKLPKLCILYNWARSVGKRAARRQMSAPQERGADSTTLYFIPL